MKKTFIQSKCPEYFLFEYIVDGKIKVRFKFIFKSSMVIDYKFESSENGYYMYNDISQMRMVKKSKVKSGDGKVFFCQYFKVDKNKSLEENVSLAKEGKLEEIPHEIIKEYIKKPSKA